MQRDRVFQSPVFYEKVNRTINKLFEIHKYVTNWIEYIIQNNPENTLHGLKNTINALFNFMYRTSYMKSVASTITLTSQSSHGVLSYWYKSCAGEQGSILLMYKLMQAITVNRMSDSLCNDVIIMIIYFQVTLFFV